MSLLLEQRMIDKITGWIKAFPDKAKEFFLDLKQEAEETALVGTQLARVFHGHELDPTEFEFDAFFQAVPLSHAVTLWTPIGPYRVWV